MRRSAELKRQSAERWLRNHHLTCAMRHYRVYSLTNGHVTGPPVLIIAADDDEALKRAEQLRDGHGLEVWDEAKLVGRLEAKD